MKIDLKGRSLPELLLIGDKLPDVGDVAGTNTSVLAGAQKNKIWEDDDF